MAPNFPVLAIPGFETFMQDLMAMAHDVMNRDPDDDDIIDMLPAVPQHVVPYLPARSHQNASAKKLEEFSITLPEVPDDSPPQACVREKNEKSAGAAAPESSTECNPADELAARREKKTQLTDAIIELRLECSKIERTWETCVPRVDIDSKEAQDVVYYATAMRCRALKRSPVAYYTAQLGKQVEIVNVQAEVVNAQAAKDHGRHANGQQPVAQPATRLPNNVSICVEAMKSLELAKNVTAVYDLDKEPLERDARLAETIKTYEAYQKVKGQLVGLQASLQAMNDIS